MTQHHSRRLRIAVYTVGLILGTGAPLTLMGAEGDVPRASPQEVGLSAERLERIGGVLQRAMDADTISGAVTLVARRGKIAHFEAHGLMDIEGSRPMALDTIFPLSLIHI